MGDLSKPQAFDAYSRNGEKLPADIYWAENPTDEVILFVGGSGDTRRGWIDESNLPDIASFLRQTGVDHNLLSFTFGGREMGHQGSLNDEVLDLAGVVDSVKSQIPGAKITLVCTSQGAYSASWIVGPTRYAPDIKRLIMLDPADYPLEQHYNSTGLASWSGVEEYAPAGYVVSDLLKAVSPDLKVDVVNFTLRNYGEDGYGTPDLQQRGNDDPEKSARLNNDMVYNFYHKSGENQGVYIENQQLPHAFNRDGDVPANKQLIAEIVAYCLSQDTINDVEQ